jgi:hypothetical protein
VTEEYPFGFFIRRRQVFGKPSSFVKTTSVGMLRIVEVMGATVTEFSTAMRNRASGSARAVACQVL